MCGFEGCALLGGTKLKNQDGSVSERAHLRNENYLAGKRKVLIEPEAVAALAMVPQDIEMSPR